MHKDLDQNKGLILEDAEHFSSHMAFTDTQYFAGLSFKFRTMVERKGEKKIITEIIDVNLCSHQRFGLPGGT